MMCFFGKSLVSGIIERLQGWLDEERKITTEVEYPKGKRITDNGKQLVTDDYQNKKQDM